MTCVLIDVCMYECVRTVFVWFGGRSLVRCLGFRKCTDWLLNIYVCLCIYVCVCVLCRRIRSWIVIRAVMRNSNIALMKSRETLYRCEMSGHSCPQVPHLLSSPSTLLPPPAHCVLLSNSPSPTLHVRMAECREASRARGRMSHTPPSLRVLHTFVCS